MGKDIVTRIITSFTISNLRGGRPLKWASRVFKSAHASVRSRLDSCPGSCTKMHSPAKCARNEIIVARPLHRRS